MATEWFEEGGWRVDSDGESTRIRIVTPDSEVGQEFFAALVRHDGDKIVEMFEQYSGCGWGRVIDELPDKADVGWAYDFLIELDTAQA